MNKTLQLLCLATTIVTGFAEASTVSAPELVSMQYVTVGRTSVALPTVKYADGSVCTSYLASTTRDKDGSVATSVKQVCGPANADGSAPENLLSLRNFESNGLLVQLPTVQVDVKN